MFGYSWSLQRQRWRWRVFHRCWWKRAAGHKAHSEERTGPIRPQKRGQIARDRESQPPYRRWIAVLLPLRHRCMPMNSRTQRAKRRRCSKLWALSRKGTNCRDFEDPNPASGLHKENLRSHGLQNDETGLLRCRDRGCRPISSEGYGQDVSGFHDGAPPLLQARSSSHIDSEAADTVGRWD